MPVRTDNSYACGQVSVRMAGRKGSCAWSELRVHTFFMIPAFRLEKVMCRRDLSWMNLMSIFLRSRPGLSSSSSSSSAAALTRGRLTPRGSVLPLPVSASSAPGLLLALGSWMSAIATCDHD